MELGGIFDAGSGKLNPKDKVFLSETIQWLNDLFEGELTGTDMANHAQGVRDKPMESGELAQQTVANTKPQSEGDSGHIVHESMHVHGYVNREISVNIFHISGPRT